MGTNPPVLPFFFLRIRPPPISTLFPYTTLFRSAPRAARKSFSSASSACSVSIPRGTRHARGAPDRTHDARTRRCPELSRSEEHTSELQSHVNLVCRLLLEKKKRHVRSQSSRRPR